jgi:2-polyprenyl-3-methyl-5-hydroxy-6-metoxy-1,4-benzoquinol methylase
VEQLLACLNCGHPSSDARPIHVRKDDALVECRRCRLLYANPQYTPDELTELYRENYYDEALTMTDDVREQNFVRWRAFYNDVVTDLVRRYPRLDSPHARALDFGCGCGSFMAALKEKSRMQIVGIDFSELAAQYVKRRFELDVMIDPERALAQTPSAHYQLVTAWQVIEHLRRPRETLRELARVLAPGGVLCIGVPNLGSWRYRVERGRWFNITNPTHLAFFNRRNLATLLRELGLKRVVRPVIRAGTPHFGKLGQLAQYVGRFTGLGTDLRLYAVKP